MGTILKHLMTRRALLKSGLYTPLITIPLGLQKPMVKQDVQSPAQPLYGTGTYGQGAYPGFQINLPLLGTKER